MVIGLKVVLADGTPHHHGRNRPTRRRRPGPEPAVRRIGGNARDRDRGPGCGFTLSPLQKAGAHGVSRTSRKASRPAVASCVAAPPPRCSGSTTRSSPSATSRTVSHAVLIVLDEADPVMLESTLAISRRRVPRMPEPNPSTSELVETLDGAPQRRLGARSALPRWDRRRHHRGRRAGGRCSQTSTTRASTRFNAVEGTLVASAHQSHSYTDGACIYLTFAGRMPEASDGEQESDAGPSATTTPPGTPSWTP